jgi:fermentation-respiration switch protein FrsA (DUF1100 family)
MKKMSRTTKLALTTLAALALVTSARGESPVAGDWAGVLKAGVDLKLILHVQQDKSGTLKATFDSPDQGSFSLPVDAVSFEGGTLTCEAKKLRAKLTAKLNTAKTELSGTWTQNGELPITLKKSEKGKNTSLDIPKALIGAWEGKLDAGGATLRIVVRVQSLPGGSFLLNLQSPDQSLVPIPISSMTHTDGAVQFECTSIRGSFKGKLDAMSTELNGEWKQGGNTNPLILRKNDKISESQRPQTPKPPFPYRAEAVTYENKTAAVKLAGTLTFPEGDGPFPAVLLITGSGPQDRDESILGHKPFLVLADHLTRRGIAVLRVDDRGVGGSTGNPATATSEDFAADVLTGLNYLKNRKEIDAKRLGLIGHSEGGIIAPMVAAKSKDVSFIVLLAGTGLPGAEIVEAQRRLISKAAGQSDSKYQANEVLVRKLIDVLKNEPDPKGADEKLKLAAKAAIESLSEGQRADLGNVDLVVAASITQLNSPWFRFFLFYDPKTALRRVSCPVLALNGERDLQVPSRENLSAIAQALKEGGNTQITTQELAGLNHLFQTCKSGSPLEYADIEETMAPQALKAISDWVLDQTRKR